MNKRKNISLFILSFLCTFSIVAMDPMDIDSDEEEDTEMDYFDTADLKELTALGEKQTELRTTTETVLENYKNNANENTLLSQEKSDLIIEFQQKVAPLIIDNLENIHRTLDAITIDTSDDSPAKKTLASAKIQYKKYIDTIVNKLKKNPRFHPRIMDSLIQDTQLFVTILSQLDKDKKSADEVVAELQKKEFIPQDSENTHTK